MLKLSTKSNLLPFSHKNKTYLLKVVIVFIILLIVSFLYSTSFYSSEVIPINKNFLSEKRLFSEEELDLHPAVPPYSLPLSLDTISNYQDLVQKIKLSSSAVYLLQKNGFTVIQTPEDIGEREVFLESSDHSAYPKDDFVAYYKAIKEKDLPVFITTDSLLHFYHIFFDTTLTRLEREVFYSDIWIISEKLLEESLKTYSQNSGNLKEAARRNIAFLSVALELLKPKGNQIANDQMLKKEYCPPDMDQETCNRLIEGIKNIYGDKVSYQYFSETELERYHFEIPELVRELVEKEISLIEKQEGWEYSPIFIYKEDYSQYIPRGHYTRSEKLKNYFKALMWYGRMTALVEGSPSLIPGESSCSGNRGGIISEYDAQIQTLQAFLLTGNLFQNQELLERWNKIYTLTSFLVGFSDDLGPYEYYQALRKIPFVSFTPQEIEKNFLELKQAIKEFPFEPKIYSGLGACELFMPCPPLEEEELQNLKIQAHQLLQNTKGFRLLGQRFTLDSWLFSEIVSPYSGEYKGPQLPLPTDEKPFTFSWDDDYPEYRLNRPFTWIKTEVLNCPPPAAREVRGFPRGLDLMACLGSERARKILEASGDTQYTDFEKTFSVLKNYFFNLSKEEWYKNLYMNWLYVLQSLWIEAGEGYPTFMQTTAWQDKELNTTLASWTELRHDTILYVKQSYTMAEKGGMFEEPPIWGYVEPIPYFYSRLLSLTEFTLQGLEKLIPTEELESLMIRFGLEEFIKILTRLKDISQKEIENITLEEDEYDFIQNFGDISENLIRIVSGGEVDSAGLKTVMVADVHTDGNTKKVLEEGVGYIKTMLVTYRTPGGFLELGVGPVFSYYEFKQPMEKRLTDEAWREILDSNPPPLPNWVKNFSNN
ncbi:MAG: DUF3160 domain-containing protein [Candidatus Caldatribacteriota bacterium]